MIIITILKEVTPRQCMPRMQRTPFRATHRVLPSLPLRAALHCSYSHLHRRHMINNNNHNHHFIDNRSTKEAARVMGAAPPDPRGTASLHRFHC